MDYIKILFIVLSLAAALLLPINRIIEVKSLPTHRDSATLHSGVTKIKWTNSYNTNLDAYSRRSTLDSFNILYLTPT